MYKNAETFLSSLVFDTSGRKKAHFNDCESKQNVVFSSGTLSWIAKWKLPHDKVIEC